jgi:hypothetical protein
MSKTHLSIGIGIIGLAFIGGIIWFATGGYDWLVRREIQRTYDQVVDDSISRYYQIPTTDYTQKCVQAGIVVAALLQSEDQRYESWRNIEDRDCNDAKERP